MYANMYPLDVTEPWLPYLIMWGFINLFVSINLIGNFKTHDQNVNELKRKKKNLIWTKNRKWNSNFLTL